MPSLSVSKGQPFASTATPFGVSGHLSFLFLTPSPSLSSRTLNLEVLTATSVCAYNRDVEICRITKKRSFEKRSFVTFCGFIKLDFNLLRGMIRQSVKHPFKSPGHLIKQMFYCEIRLQLYNTKRRSLKDSHFI